MVAVLKVVFPWMLMVGKIALPRPVDGGMAKGFTLLGLVAVQDISLPGIMWVGGGHALRANKQGGTTRDPTPRAGGGAGGCSFRSQATRNISRQYTGQHL